MNKNDVKKKEKNEEKLRQEKRKQIFIVLRPDKE